MRAIPVGTHDKVVMTVLPLAYSHTHSYSASMCSTLSITHCRHSCQGHLGVWWIAQGHFDMWNGIEPPTFWLVDNPLYLWLYLLSQVSGSLINFNNINHCLSFFHLAVRQMCLVSKALLKQSKGRRPHCMTVYYHETMSACEWKHSRSKNHVQQLTSVCQTT